MKRTFLIAVVVAAFAACGDNSQNDTANSSDSTTAGQAPTTPSLSDTGIGTGAGADTAASGMSNDTRSGIGNAADPTLAPSKMDTTKR